jgi:DNA ligase 1
MKPMLAATASQDNIKLPALASAKLDGIRGIIKGGVVLSRSLKPIPNKIVQGIYGRPEFNGLDGEFIVGSPTAEDVYRKTNSKLMTIEGDADEVTFFAFDMWNQNDIYANRFKALTKILPNIQEVKIHENSLVKTLDEVDNIENLYVNEGYEGLMLRDPNSPYKFGRSTVNQAYLLKIKRFEDAEAVIIGFAELMHNDNEATVNELGYTERSSHKENKRPSGTLGTLKVKCLKNGWEFEIGTGFTASQRKELWDIRDTLTNKIVKYKYFPVGMKDLPRHPVFLGFRSKLDL